MRSIDFADLSAGIYGSVRGEQVALVVGEKEVALTGLEFSEHAVRGPGGLALEFAPLLGPAAFGDGAEEWLCAVRGEAAGQRVDCLGSLTRGAPAGRAVAAWVDPGLAFSCRAPRGYPERDELEAWVLRADGPAAVDDPRLSTAYANGDTLNRAGLELWEAEESEYPLRLDGDLVAAVELERSRCTFLVWQCEGQACAGRYELAR
ncbi:MAG: hypothetical protein NVSMB51_16530 [Solirubrobacteraceae bacterium]